MKHRDEIDALYRKIQPALYGYAYGALGNHALAEEAVQDTFVIVCQKEEYVLSCKNPGGWAFRVLQNVIGNTRREQEIHRRITSEYVAQHTGKVVSVEDQVKLEILYEDLAELDSFTLLMDRTVEEKSYLEISQERGITVDNCRKMMQRAKKILKKYFE